MPEPVIQVRKLHKTFGKVVALNNVSFRLSGGETIGLLGGNGAGKSTLLNALMAFIAPTEGRLFAFGKEAARRKVRGSVDWGAGLDWFVA